MIRKASLILLVLLLSSCTVTFSPPQEQQYYGYCNVSHEWYGTPGYYGIHTYTGVDCTYY